MLSDLHKPMISVVDVSLVTDAPIVCEGFMFSLDPEVIKLFSCYSQLTMKLPLLIEINSKKITVFLALKLKDGVFFLLIIVKCQQ